MSEALEDRRAYRVVCRNFNIGVYSAKHRLVLGRRKKFDSVFVDAEPPRFPQPLDEFLPPEIELTEGHSICNTCGAPTAWTQEKGRFHVDEASTCQNLDPVYQTNRPLREWLEALERKYP